MTSNKESYCNFIELKAIIPRLVHAHYADDLADEDDHAALLYNSMYPIGHTKNLVTRKTIFISHCRTLGQTATCRPESHFQVMIVVAIVRLTRRVFHK